MQNLIITLSGYYFINNTIFFSCSSTYHGGSIFIDATSSFFYCFRCIFEKSHSDLWGGALCIHKCSSAYTKELCFFNCTSQRCHGYLFYGHGYVLNHCQLNYSLEICPYLCTLGSVLVGTETSYGSNNNCSNTNTNQYSTGFFYGSGISMELGSFNQIQKCTGQTLFAFCNSVINLINSISNFNFINNSINYAWITIWMKKTNSYIKNSIFINNPNLLLIYEYATSGSIINYNNCDFTNIYDLNYHSSISTINNNFNYLNSHNIILKNYCYSQITKISKQNILFYFHMFIFIL